LLVVPYTLYGVGKAKVSGVLAARARCRMTFVRRVSKVSLRETHCFVTGH